MAAFALEKALTGSKELSTLGPPRPSAHTLWQDSKPLCNPGPCYSKNRSGITSSSSSTWEPLGNAESQAPPQTCSIKICILTSPLELMCSVKLEKGWHRLQMEEPGPSCVSRALNTVSSQSAEGWIDSCLRAVVGGQKGEGAFERVRR